VSAAISNKEKIFDERLHFISLVSDTLDSNRYCIVHIGLQVQGPNQEFHLNVHRKIIAVDTGRPRFRRIMEWNEEEVDNDRNND